jgi:hypothetical protein
MAVSPHYRNAQHVSAGGGLLADALRAAKAGDCRRASHLADLGAEYGERITHGPTRAKFDQVAGKVQARVAGACRR